MLTTDKFLAFVAHKPATTVINRTPPWGTVRGAVGGTIFDFVKHHHGKALASVFFTPGRDVQWRDMSGRLHATELPDTIRKIVEDVENEYGDLATFGNIHTHLLANQKGGAI